MPTKSTSLALGGTFSTSVIALMGVGYLLLQGPTITDRNVATEVCSQYGSGAFLCYDDVVLTGTGGVSGYTSGSIQCGTASCSLLRVEVQTEAAAAAKRIDVGIVSTLTASGQGIINSGQTASGQTLYSNSGGLIPSNYYIKALYTATGPGNVTAQMRIWYSKFYVP